MPTLPREDPRTDARGPAGPLGPYETSYDVRRGYDDRAVQEPARTHRSRGDRGWIGRPAER